MTPTERYHALDCLQAFAMFFGIVLHGVLSFAVPPVPFWPVRDPAAGPAASVFLLAVHGFRMQTFFVLAGFFGGLLAQRYGPAGMLRHRFRRIAVPFALAVLLVEPTLQVLWLVGDPEALRACGLVRRPAGVGVWAALTVPLLWPMETWTPDTPGGWVPPARVLAYYIAFLAFGGLLYRHRAGSPGSPAVDE